MYQADNRWAHVKLRTKYSNLSANMSSAILMRHWTYLLSCAVEKSFFCKRFITTPAWYDNVISASVEQIRENLSQAASKARLLTWPNLVDSNWSDKFFEKKESQRSIQNLHSEVHGHAGRHTNGCHLGCMPLDVTLFPPINSLISKKRGFCVKLNHLWQSDQSSTNPVYCNPISQDDVPQTIRNVSLTSIGNNPQGNALGIVPAMKLNGL